MSSTDDHNDASRALGCALTMAVLLAAGAIAGVCTTLAGADTGETERAQDYESQHHVGAHTGEEPGCVIVDLFRSCEPIPADMARDVVAVVQCESRWDPAAIGAAGEKGLLQIHVRVHGPAMIAAGLDPTNEADRIRWAVNLFQQHGWAPWSCLP